MNNEIYVQRISDEEEEEDMSNEMQDYFRDKFEDEMLEDFYKKNPDAEAGEKDKYFWKRRYLHVADKLYEKEKHGQ